MCRMWHSENLVVTGACTAFIKNIVLLSPRIRSYFLIISKTCRFISKRTRRIKLTKYLQLLSIAADYYRSDYSSTGYRKCGRSVFDPRVTAWIPLWKTAPLVRLLLCTQPKCTRLCNIPTPEQCRGWPLFNSHIGIGKEQHLVYYM
jgi:hypothetical protein